jgi:isoamylase
VPMLLGGDEFGRTQRGNNNAYSQDNEISWFDWSPDPRGERLLAFTRQLIALRRDHPVLRRRRWYEGRAREDGVPDLRWLRDGGGEMTDADWTEPGRSALGMVMHGDALTEPGPDGHPIAGETLALLLNGGEDAARFDLPGNTPWQVLVDTLAPAAEGRAAAAGHISVPPRSVLLLKAIGEPGQ